jgi:hypothetical protein
MPQHYASNLGESDLAPTRLTRGILGRSDPASIKALRCRNYRQLYQRLPSLEGVRPLMGQLPEAVCPLNFPLVTPDARPWADGLRQLGVDAGKWWLGRHPDVDLTPFPEAHRLKRSVVTLPIHQAIDEADIEYMAAALGRVASVLG